MVEQEETRGKGEGNIKGKRRRKEKRAVRKQKGMGYSKTEHWGWAQKRAEDWRNRAGAGGGVDSKKARTKQARQLEGLHLTDF